MAKNTCISKALKDNGLESIVELEALKMDNEPFTVLFIQPREDVRASVNFIGNVDRQSARAKYEAFLGLARNEGAKLVITPEYGCPWDVVEREIKKGAVPAPGALWALGCESVTPEQFRARVLRHPEVVWIYDRDALDKSGEFLDPICYLFHARDKEQRTRLVAAVQFKSEPMSAKAAPLEFNHMIRGNERYIFSNGKNSIHLVTLICSDALAFDVDQVKDLPPGLTHPYLILHPQLNTDPLNNLFGKYRREFFRFDANALRDIVCVNWAKEFAVGNKASDYGGSAVYTKSKQLILTDDRINNNDAKGLYYTGYHCQRAHIYFFNYAEHVFLLNKEKPAQVLGTPVSQVRGGPEMKKVYSWNASGWKPGVADDGFLRFCKDFDADLSPLADSSMSALERERLLVLSTGGVKCHKEWYDVAHLPSFDAKADEVMRRLTVLQDPSPEVNGVRDELLAKFNKLRNGILTKKKYFPRPLKSFAGNSELLYSKAEGTRVYNLWSKDGKSRATVAYVGDRLPKAAEKIFETIYQLLPDADKKRLTVWYTDADGIKTVNRNTRKITQTPPPDGRSYLREGD